jgi:hypothetical protein
LDPADLPRLYRELATLSWDAGDHEQGQRMCRLACAADPADRDLRLLQLGLTRFQQHQFVSSFLTRGCGGGIAVWHHAPRRL